MNTFFLVIVGFLILTLVLVGYVIVSVGKRGLSKSDKELVKRTWQDIQVRSSTEPKIAIIESDKLLDYILRRLRYDGTLGEKLKLAAPLFGDLDGVWRAHKLRNTIAHEMSFVPTEKQVKDALKQFERAFRDLHAL